MKFAVVINSCCMQSRADTHVGPSGKPYSIRQDFLKNIILPRLKADPYVVSIVVAGEYEPGEGYDYVPVTGSFANCRDVPAQRQAGYEKVRRMGADATLFLMDDHVPAPDFFRDVHASLVDVQWDVFTPNRRSHRTGATLNSGWNGVGVMDPLGRYAHTHGIVLTRKASDQCPWSGLTPIYRFDVLHTMWFTDRNLTIHTAGSTFIEDLED